MSTDVGAGSTPAPDGPGELDAAALADLVAATRAYVAQADAQRDQAMARAIQLTAELDTAHADIAQLRGEVGRLVKRLTDMTYAEAAREELVALTVYDLTVDGWLA